MKGGTPPSPLPTFVHRAHRRSGQGKLDRQEEEGGRSLRSFLRWTNSSGSNTLSVGQPLMCQVEYAASSYIKFYKKGCNELDKEFQCVTFYDPCHFLFFLYQKVRALALPAVNLMQADRVRHTLSKENHTSTLRLLILLQHLYVYSLFSLLFRKKHDTT